jgi:hypothetical protein
MELFSFGTFALVLSWIDMRNTKAQFEVLTFTKVNHFFALEVMITRSRFGISRLVVVSLPSWGTWTISALCNFILKILGSYLLRMIKLFEYGTGSLEIVFQF